MNEIEYLKIITPFKDKIFRIARRLLVSVEEAEDATQEVLLKLWNHRQKFKDYKSPEAFAMTMTKNRAFLSVLQPLKLKKPIAHKRVSCFKFMILNLVCMY